jgi:hypothetical protein
MNLIVEEDSRSLWLKKEIIKLNWVIPENIPTTPMEEIGS